MQSFAGARPTGPLVRVLRIESSEVSLFSFIFCHEDPRVHLMVQAGEDDAYGNVVARADRFLITYTLAYMFTVL